MKTIREVLATHGRPEICTTGQASQFITAAFTGMLKAQRDGHRHGRRGVVGWTTCPIITTVAIVLEKHQNVLGSLNDGALMNRSLIICALAAIGSGTPGDAAFGSMNPIEVGLTDMGNNVLRVSYKNTTDRNISFLKYNTPFFTNDKLFGNYFTFIGVSPKYIGFSGLKIKITDEGFITLKPHEVMSTQVPLDRSYAFKTIATAIVRYTGHITYKVYSGKRFNSNADLATETLTSREEPIEVFANTHHFTYNSRGPVWFVPPFHASHQVVDSSCVGNFAEDANLAYRYALTLVDTALTDLDSLDVADVPTGQLNSPRYNLWFGWYFATAFNFVKQTYKNIKDKFPQVTIYCNCPTTSDYDNAYAYSDLATPYTVVVCNQFWSSPIIGTDSKAGTLVHEMSHFYDVGGTSDMVYGQDASRNLASSTPISATHNADNYEYFSENDPFTPIK